MRVRIPSLDVVAIVLVLLLLLALVFKTLDFTLCTRALSALRCGLSSLSLLVSLTYHTRIQAHMQPSVSRNRGTCINNTHLLFPYEGKELLLSDFVIHGYPCHLVPYQTASLHPFDAFSCQIFGVLFNHWQPNHFVARQFVGICWRLDRLLSIYSAS